MTIEQLHSEIKYIRNHDVLPVATKKAMIANLEARINKLRLESSLVETSEFKPGDNK